MSLGAGRAHRQTAKLRKGCIAWTWVGFAFAAAVTALAAPGKPADLPEQGLDAFAEAFREEAEDTTAQQILAWLNTVDGEDTIPDVLDSPSVTAFLQQLPDVSAYVAEGSSPKEQAVAARLGDSEDAVSDVPELTALLGELPDLSRYVEAGGGGSGEQ